ncbi:MAG: replicative DNA helicase [bacterium]|nr:replicative DNA helicase [bacterium]
MNREIPSNIDAEKSVLGAMFLSKFALQKAVESLSVESFFLDKHGKIFDCLKDLFNRQVAIDITTVTDELKNRKILKEVGGVEYLTEILDETPTASNVEYYIDIVEDKSILRNLINEATDIVTMGYETNNPVSETLDKAESKILNVVKNRKSTEFKTMPEVLTTVQETLEKLASNKGKISGLSTGLFDLDKITNGFHENELIILAARPAMGKTALALNMATNIAMNEKKSVIIFTLEMRAEQLVSRMISSVGQIDASKLQNGNLLNEDWKRVNEAMSELGETNIYIDDSPGVTIGDIKAKSRRIASLDENLGAIFIDYLTLIATTNKYAGNRQQEVSEISRALKTLALELKIPVICLAQLSRTPELREDKRPILSDLRESGSIEQDADIVAFIYRDDYYHPENKLDDNMSKTEVIVRKNRSGSIGTAELLFKKNTLSFLNYKKDNKEGEKLE